MWAVYLVFLVLAFVRAAKLQYCQELVLKGSALRKDVATMVFTMDGTCAVCYREIQKLVRLKTQMARLGHSADILVALDQLPRQHEHELPSEVTVDLADAWAKLGQLNGHIFVFDKCGKLAYQVITPWSRQIYPFTAMAGLSALYDAPCGECNVTSQVTQELQNELSLDKFNHSQRNESKVVEMISEAVELQENKLPLKITTRGGHIETRSHEKIDLETNDSKYQGAATRASELGTSESTANVTDARMNETQSDDVTRYASQGKNVSSDAAPEGKGVATTTEATKPPANQDDHRELLKRYQPLMRWRTCANMIMSVLV